MSMGVGSPRSRPRPGSNQSAHRPSSSSPNLATSTTPTSGTRIGPPNVAHASVLSKTLDADFESVGLLRLRGAPFPGPPPYSSVVSSPPPPVGAIPVTSLAPPHSLAGTHPHSTVPLLASQLGQPVSLGARAIGGNLAAAHIMAQSLSPLGTIPAGHGRVMSRNVNGTFAVTNQPSNESELQLYRVLQRANLLQYYDVFIAQGGDDVHQLCEAGEEEFLEIMALVGMASKPLHVRRLQKALQEWAQNPGLFQAPLVPLSNFTAPSAAAAVIRGGGLACSTPPTVVPSGGATSTAGLTHGPISNASTATGLTTHSPLTIASSMHSSPVTATVLTSSPILPPSTSAPSATSANLSVLASGGGPERGANFLSRSSPPLGAIPFPPSTPPSLPSAGIKDNHNSISSAASAGGSSPAYSQSGMEYPPMSTSPLQLTPVLVEGQIQKIADTAAALVKELPPTFDMKQPTNKKKISKEVEGVLGMPNEDPKKMDEVRKFSAIYGRFDCKRKPEKPLTLHEVSVNEAAAQLCYLIPALLTRRDELFPLARQVVRDSGYQYSKGHSRSQFIAGFPSKLFGANSSSVHSNGSDTRHNEDSNSRDSVGGAGDMGGPPAAKKGRYDSSDSQGGSANQAEEEAQLRRKRRIEAISMEVNAILEEVETLQKAAEHAKDDSNLALFKSISQEVDRLTLKQAELVHEQHEHMKFFRAKPQSASSTNIRTNNTDYAESPGDGNDHDPLNEDDQDEEDNSRLSAYSNTSSPPPTSGSGTITSGNFVLSESGGQIIAVQNPALVANTSLRGHNPLQHSHQLPLMHNQYHHLHLHHNPPNADGRHSPPPQRQVRRRGGGGSSRLARNNGTSSHKSLLASSSTSSVDSTSGDPPAHRCSTRKKSPGLAPPKSPPTPSSHSPDQTFKQEPASPPASLPPPLAPPESSSSPRGHAPSSSPNYSVQCHANVGGSKRASKHWSL
ncbi:NGFI-A-binding protein homolog isoform X2 [Tigriopus californicus]|uniref:NGFI-A-binding protein homolog isoform X2 n=1 Tax=Tigriopus californicus TaxID=6832 RepID=UPI0027DAB47D|nr:NGFI-A-binding protein homolog isoform X2 [Tigriopus californicus]